MNTSPTDQPSVTSPRTEGRPSDSFEHRLKSRFSLHEDKAPDDEIEARIRDGVELRGATPWILMFAIFVASVGLNVNSTAVIIGAMLISPLMGPIMGTGLGVAVYDFDLVKRSLNNLGIATLISLVVSAIYFALSPLQHAQSELLARTTPTIWDVLIALFGGLAGVIGITRRERSNVIPGVAIATALMPPVCTAGYGLATQQWAFVGGALYLYTINCVFIALATVIGIRALKLKQHGFATPAMAKRVKSTLLILALSTALPSVYLAIDLIRKEVFKVKAQAFITQEFKFPNARVVDSTIDPIEKVIELTVVGDPIPAESIQALQYKLNQSKLQDTKISVHQMDQRVDVSSLKASLLSDLLRDSQTAIQDRDQQIRVLSEALQSKTAQFNLAVDATKELRQIYPAIDGIYFGEGIQVNAEGKGEVIHYLQINTKHQFAADEKARIKAWFLTRMKLTSVRLTFNH